MEEEDLKELELGINPGTTTHNNAEKDLDSSLLDLEEEADEGEIGNEYKSEDELEDFISGIDTHSVFSGGGSNE